jgi:hypothetical protein
VGDTNSNLDVKRCIFRNDKEDMSLLSEAIFSKIGDGKTIVIMDEQDDEKDSEYRQLTELLQAMMERFDKYTNRRTIVNSPSPG